MANLEIYENGDVARNEDEYISFVSIHRLQLETSGVPEHYWKTLYQKLTTMEFDAGKVFSMLYVEYDDGEEETEESRWKVVVSADDGVDPQEPSQIYLVDHAWTFHAQDAESMLHEMPELLDRMASLMDIPPSENRETLVNQVLRSMWKYNQTYSFGGINLEAETTVPVWYIMDEFGSRIQHGEQPTCRVVPFLYLPSGMTFSLLFPTRILQSGEELTRNYIEGLDLGNGPDREILKSVLMLPWQEVDLSRTVDSNQVEPDDEFMRSGRIEETLPEEPCKDPLQVVHREVAFKVYAEYSAIREHLTHPAFRICANPDEADILWYHFHFKEFRQLSINHSHKLINQFPFEHVLTVKDLLAVICRRCCDRSHTVDPDNLATLPPWLPTTYNLTTEELPRFVAYFQQRAKRGLDNLWIVKPWNLARSLDTTITDNLSHIIRLRATGPKIACKYISDPVLYSRPEVGPVKFDIRYILLVRSLAPLEAYIYSRFWLRFANKPFALDNLGDYQQHFTVMNYNDAPLQQMFCDDFINNFEKQYPGYQWQDIQTEILAVFRQVFEAAMLKKPPSGPYPCLQSRAMYAADLMLQWDRTEPESPPRIQPMLLEINWAPDCQRACDYYPDFFNDVFSTLFLDQPTNVVPIHQ